MTNTNDMEIKMQKKQNERGITLLITLLLMGVLLGVSSSLLNVTLKQYQLSGIALSSEVAFQAANAGLECILYNDFPVTGSSTFAVPNDGNEQAVSPSVLCMGESLPVTNSAGDGRAASSEEQLFEVSVYKFSDADDTVPVEVDGRSFRSTDCPAGSVCTVVQARGYNVPCASINGSARVVEREYTQVY
jgi:hypothetical protein